MEIHRLETLLHFLNLTTSFALLGLILVIQLAHYPLFDHIDRGNFTYSMHFHQRRMALIVVPFMVTEFIVAVGLTVVSWGPLALIQLGLVGIIWASTFFLQVPFHQTLLLGHNSGAIKGLVQTNWLRTVCWGLRAGISFYGCWTL